MVPLVSREVDTFHHGPTLLLKESGTCKRPTQREEGLSDRTMPSCADLGTRLPSLAVQADQVNSGGRRG